MTDNPTNGTEDYRIILTINTPNKLIYHSLHTVEIRGEKRSKLTNDQDFATLMIVCLVAMSSKASSSCKCETKLAVKQRLPQCL